MCAIYKYGHPNNKDQANDLVNKTPSKEASVQDCDEYYCAQKPNKNLNRRRYSHRISEEANTVEKRNNTNKIVNKNSNDTIYLNVVIFPHFCSVRDCLCIRKARYQEAENS